MCQGGGSAATAPAISQRFSLRSPTGECSALWRIRPQGRQSSSSAGRYPCLADASAHEVDIRIGVVGGMITASLPIDELRSAVIDTAAPVQYMGVGIAEPSDGYRLRSSSRQSRR